MKRIAKLALTMVLTAGTVAIPGTAQAANQGELTISPSIGSVEKSYPRIDGQKGAAGGLFATFRPPGCETYAYCDTIKLNVQVPSGYNEIYYVGFILSYDKGATNNRVDLHVWGNDDPALGAEIARDTGPHQPKKAQVGEPPNGPLWITVVNITGVNSGYKLKVFWSLTDLGPDYRKKPSPPPSPSPTPKKSPTPAQQVALPSPSPETIKVKVPGPDGQPTEIAIPLVKTQGVAKKADEGGSPIVPLVLAALGAGLGIFLYLFVWRRRRAQS